MGMVSTNFLVTSLSTSPSQKRLKMEKVQTNTIKEKGGGKTGTGKRVDIEVRTQKYLFKVNMRDTQGTDGYPTRIMGDFTYL